MSAHISPWIALDFLNLILLIDLINEAANIYCVLEGAGFSV